MAVVLTGREKTDTQGKDSYVPTGAEMAVMRPQAKQRQGWQQPSEAGGKTDSSLEPPEGAWPGQHHHFKLRGSRTTSTSTLVVSSHPDEANSLHQPQK